MDATSTSGGSGAAYGGGAPDVAVVGAGPNGLAAAVTLARAGLSVEMYEAADEIGGGLRTVSLFDDEVRHDICSAVHPMAAASPFFREFDLPARGVRLETPEISYAHPLDGGRAGIAHRDLEATCEALGADGPRWRRLMRPLLDHSTALVDFILSGQRALPRHPAVPLLLARAVLEHGTPLARRAFVTEEARALFTGVAAHAIGPLPSLPGAVVGSLLAHLAHGTGWPLPVGGSGAMAEALADDLAAHGGTVHTGRRITDLKELPGARAVLLDTSPQGLLEIAGDRLPPAYARRLRAYRYGPAAAKADFLVSEPVPWANPEVGRAGSVHIGGTQAEMFHQEKLAFRGTMPDRPFALVVDPAVTDPGRARPGRRPLWAYAHVPNGAEVDPVELLRSRIEAYAPGFTDTIVAARGTTPAQYEAYNPNYVGGDIAAGALTLTQSVFRPSYGIDPYRTPLPGLYLCSAATPPGPSVHGMCGYLAAKSVLRREFGIRSVPSLAPKGAAPLPPQASSGQGDT